jgi:hypothetical protein
MELNRIFFTSGCFNSQNSVADKVRGHLYYLARELAFLINAIECKIHAMHQMRILTTCLFGDDQAKTFGCPKCDCKDPKNPKQNAV